MKLANKNGSMHLKAPQAKKCISELLKARFAFEKHVPRGVFISFDAQIPPLSGLWPYEDPHCFQIDPNKGWVRHKVKGGGFYIGIPIPAPHKFRAPPPKKKLGGMLH